MHRDLPHGGVDHNGAAFGLPPVEVFQVAFIGHAHLFDLTLDGGDEGVVSGGTRGAGTAGVHLFHALQQGLFVKRVGRFRYGRRLFHILFSFEMTPGATVSRR